jgi:hypothetical protein
MAVVTRASAAPVAGQIVRVHARLIAGPPMTTGSAQLESVYSPAQDAGREACFVRFSPPPSAPPDAGVGTAASVVVRFSEPMDPATVSGLETFAITTAPPPAGPGDRISARASPNVFQDEFQLTPQVLLPHVAGTSETYFVDLASGPRGPRDLAGNPLRDALPPIPFHLDPAEATRHSGNYVLRFESADEDGNGHPEIRGQFLRDLAQGAILPRPVARFSAVADRTQTRPRADDALAAGVTTPLAPLGSRLHAIWRYCDLGLDLLDESFTNVDVEGLAWSPAGGAVVADQYAQFEMSFRARGLLARRGRRTDEPPSGLSRVGPRRAVRAQPARRRGRSAARRAPAPARVHR